MDKTNLRRLLEEQDKGLNNCCQKIETWEKFKKDYESLQGHLHTLPDKMSYDIMVPFGSLAFMPGKLIHTNEITVLLGDEYFVERSAKQAAEIAGRRIKQCEKMLSDLEKEKEQLQNWQQYTGDIKNEDLVEIVEDYNPEKEKAWREKHKRSVQAYHRKLAEEMKVANNDDSSREEPIPAEEFFLTDSEIKERLSFLETIEENNDELANEEQDSDDESSGSSEYTHSENEDVETKKQIKWKDQVCPKTNIITFTHTADVTSDEESSQEDEPDTDQATTEPLPRIQSPSDIYKEFVNNVKSRELKSILKTKSSKEVVDKKKVLFSKNESTPIVNDTKIYPLAKYSAQPSVKKEEISCIKDPTVSENTKPAVSSEVQEKNPELKTQSQSPKTTRHVSKFKAQRMARKV